MKMKYFFSALTAGMVLLSACSQNDDLENGGVEEVGSAAQQIVLQVPSTGDGLQTRAGRPLYSSEAKQAIENVTIIITNNTDNKVAFVYTEDDWMNESAAYTNGGHGRELIINIEDFGDKLAEGKYTVYAFGYSNNSDYDLSAITDAAAGSTFDANPIISFSSTATNKVGEEIFAGNVSDLDVKEGTGFKTSVVLNRQVAGTFGYFGDIPYEEGATKLQLVACQLNTKLVLGEFYNTNLTGNGTGNTSYYVVNGTTTGTETVVYTIPLTDWFTTVKDDNNDGLIDTDSWKTPTTFGKDAAFKEGSVFGGSFVLPFEKKGSDNTFVLKLTNDNDDVLRSWTVKLPTGDGQLTEHTLFTWGSTTSKFASEEITDTQTAYSVVRNHLYGIGKKALDKATTPDTDPDGGDDEDPEVPEDDEPESLSKKQELILRVNDNWQVLHQMEVEEN